MARAAAPKKCARPLPIRVAAQLEIGLVNELRGRQRDAVVRATQMVARHAFQFGVDSTIQLWITRRLLALGGVHNEL